MDIEIFKTIKNIENIKQKIKIATHLYNNNSISPQIAPYYIQNSLKTLQEEENLHLSILKISDSFTIKEVLPGIFSTYFKLLNDNKIKKIALKNILESMEYILRVLKDVKLDIGAEKKIHDFLYLYNYKDLEVFKNIFYHLSIILTEERKIFFIRKLILMEFNFNFDISILKDTLTFEEIKIKEDLEILRILLKNNNYEDLCVFNRLIEKYKSKKFKKEFSNQIENLIYMIQNKHFNSIISPVIELSPINSKSIASINKCNDVESIEKYIEINLNRSNGFVGIDESSLILIYLENKSKDFILNSYFSKICDIKNVINENYDLILNEIYDQIDIKNVKKINVLNNLLDFQMCNRIDDLIKKSVSCLHEAVDLNKTKEGCHLLHSIKIIVQKKFLKRGILKSIFDELLYCNSEDFRIRDCIYEIYIPIFEEYKEIDKYIESYNESKESETEMEVFENKNVLEQKVVDEDFKKINEDNTKVLAAKLWDDFMIPKKAEELYTTLNLLRTVIQSTNNFYEKRFQSANLLTYLINLHPKRNIPILEKRRYESFLELLKVVLQNFNLTKKTFEQIFYVGTDMYVYFPEKCNEIFSMLYLKDKYFLFFCFCCNFNGFKEFEFYKKQEIKNEKLKNYIYKLFI